MNNSNIKLEQLDEFRWIVPQEGDMLVPGLIFADEKLIDSIRQEQAAQQIRNAAHLPGIQKYSMAMPDIHWGYGLPIGGVVATDVKNGVISPGGVGSDINCGVRLVRTNLEKKDIRKDISRLIKLLFRNIPCGVGKGGKIRLSGKDRNRVLREGAHWAVKNGYGVNEDLEHTEDTGRLEGADPAAVSKRASERAVDQLGTLGAGNHFLEIQVVTDIYDERTASAMGIIKGRIVVMIHSGSRGFGYQVCDDFVQVMLKSMSKYNISLPDKQLTSVPVLSPEGQQYLKAMRCAANYAWANRQVLMHWVRESFGEYFSTKWQKLGMSLVYDVAHNIAKIETYEIDGKKMKLCVHRKGATRSLPKGHPLVPDIYKSTGQPVIVPGDMGSCSYLLAGGDNALEYSFGSCCHGAGRVMSRHKAIRKLKGRSIEQELLNKGIFSIARGRNSLKEEAPEAYKDVSHIVEIVHNAGLAKKVARLKPLGVAKG